VDGGYLVVTEAGETHEADHVLVTVPAYAAARILRGLDATAADLLAGMHFASTATVFLAFKREHVDHPLDATGFIVPRSGDRLMLACTWVSSKWERRAPNGRVLVRIFLGGAAGEAILEREDDDLVRIAARELGTFVPLRAPPVFARVYRHMRASPQPSIGHLGRMRRIRAGLAAFPGIHLAGGGYDGVGIPDCVKQAESLVQKMLSSQGDSG
jgi:oxygen-dependent protoporphyrinogen oxidase